MAVNWENVDRWRDQAGIDYFTQFVKAWIAFNAWYRATFDETRDRDAIEHIKDEENRVRTRIRYLLDDQGTDGESFRSWVGVLHYRTLQAGITSHDALVSFNNLCNVAPIQTQYDEKYRGVRYFVNRNIPNQLGRIIIRITGQNNQLIFNVQQQGKHDWSWVETHTDFKKLSQNQVSLLRKCYRIIDPNRAIDLVTGREGNSYEMGDYHFCNDRTLVTRGIIEMIYMLRNVLFHGAITPDSQANEVYEAAYYILYEFVKVLRS